MDAGDPISYLVLATGTPVLAAGGQQVGTVDRVLAVAEADVFDGIVVRTSGGTRFADADQVDEIRERAVMLRLSAAEAGALPAHEAGGVAYDADPVEGWRPEQG